MKKFRNLKHAPVAQLDRVGGFEPLGRGFESLRVRHIIQSNNSMKLYDFAHDIDYDWNFATGLLII